MKDLIKILLAVAAVTALATIGFSSGSNNLTSETPLEQKQQFRLWMDSHGKRYGSETEYLFRMKKFISNYEYIRNHNERYQNKLQTFQLGLNLFADIDNQQYIERYLTTRAPTTNQCTGSVKILDQIPYEHDWSPRAVTKVKNAGSCRSSWAFAAVGALEGLASLTRGQIFNLSAQQIVDCSDVQPYNNKGCAGGQIDNSFWYVIDNGITNQQKYAYTGSKQACKYTSSMKVFQNSRCAQVKRNHRRALQSAVIQNPVAVWLDASSLAFQFYKRGIFKGNCGTNLNNAMVLTGYGTVDQQDYWKCKSSYGNTWGQEGYIFLYRDKELMEGPGKCGIQMQSSLPLQ